MNGPHARGAFWHDRRVLVTGATGKVGRRLVWALIRTGAKVAILTRNPDAGSSLWPGAPIGCRRADLTDAASLAGVLDAIDTVFHLASHSPTASEPDIYEAPSHWSVTALGTRNLVQVAVASQVRDFVFASSVKAMGDAAGARGYPADERFEPKPESLYGYAKLDAERSVLGLGLGGGVKVSVLRLPMVYGIRGKGNIARMFDAVARSRFPPWPRFENRRSAVHVDDAVRALLALADNPIANGKVYLVTDGRHYSTRWLYERIARALRRDVPTWTVPLWALRLAAGFGSALEQAAGRAMPLNRERLSKLIGDAWYSSAKIQSELDFVPLHDMEEEIQVMAKRYFGCQQRYNDDPKPQR